MAVYNGNPYIKDQVYSVLRQLETEDEVVIIDDLSSDGSGEWVSSLNDPRINVYVNPCNLGVLASFERGLAMASHPIIFLCDQDDVWFPSKRAEIVSAFESDRDVLVVLSDAQLIDADGVVTSPSFMTPRGGFRGGVFHTLIRNHYLGCTMAFRRELLRAVLPMPRYIPMHDMWIGSLGAVLGKVVFIDRPLIKYRRHSKNVSPDHHRGWLKMLGWRFSLFFALTIRLATFRLQRVKAS